MDARGVHVGELLVFHAQSGHGFNKAGFALARGAPQFVQVRRLAAGRARFQHLNGARVPGEFFAQLAHLQHGVPVDLSGVGQAAAANRDQIGQAAGLGLLHIDEGGFAAGLGRRLRRSDMRTSAS